MKIVKKTIRTGVCAALPGMLDDAGVLHRVANNRHRDYQREETAAYQRMRAQTVNM